MTTIVHHTFPLNLAFIMCFHTSLMKKHEQFMCEIKLTEFQRQSLDSMHTEYTATFLLFLFKVDLSCYI